MSRIDEAIKAKKVKRSQLEEKGVVVHPYNFDKKHSIEQAHQLMDQSVQTAGRIMAVRTHGKVIFYDLKDSTGKIQVMVRQGDTNEEVLELVPLIDAGDFIGVTGQVITTKTGATTILASSLTFLGKALRPLPSEWNTAENKEARFRKRYLDMLINPLVKKTLDTRWLVVKEIRRFLQDEHNYTEVETPVFQPLYGGTNATPFTTHMKALDCQFYLRLAPELYLKRLIVGGYERIFEIARNFRNEGIDQTHQPEFSMIEWYETYADYQRIMNVAEALIKHLVLKVHGQSSLEVHDRVIEMGGDWPRINMKEAIGLHLKLDFDALSDQDLVDLMKENQIELIGSFTRGKALFAIFDKLVTAKLIEPTWIIDYPRDVSPLSKKHRTDPALAERFELYVGGKELADGWSEITDPIDQRQIFENEQRNLRAGDTEAHPLDEDFLEAMEYGVPPLGGIGMGIDRLVMFLTNTWSIKEVIAFPTLKPLILNTPSETKPSGAKEGKSIPSTVSLKQPELDKPLPSRESAHNLLGQYIKEDALRHHCQMVARAMEAYATKLGQDSELWYQTGLLHDLDWEAFPDEHPNKAIKELLADYPSAVLDAIAAHAPERTGKKPQTILERYLFACDELSGFMHAVSLMRPGGFSDMKAKSITKKLKDKSFAAAVPREDINQGAELIDTPLSDHITFLIEVFREPTD